MSDKPIQVGDLVMVVRGCCPHKSFGVPWRVEGVVHKSGNCSVCHKEIPESPVAVGTFMAPLSWLKRLDPDALKDDVPTKEERPSPVTVEDLTA